MNIENKETEQIVKDLSAVKRICDCGSEIFYLFNSRKEEYECSIVICKECGEINNLQYWE